MMYEFTTKAEAEQFLANYHLNIDSEKYYISAIQIYFAEFKLCPECGEKFTAKKSNQIYHDTRCGTKARMREWRRKKAAEKG